MYSPTPDLFLKLEIMRLISRKQDMDIYTRLRIGLVLIIGTFFNTLHASDVEQIGYCAASTSSGIHVEPKTVGIISVYREATEFGDLKGLETAFLGAALRAKGQITDYLTENNQNSVTRTDIRKKSGLITQVGDAGGKNREVTLSREESDILELVTSNFSEQSLSGVMKFEESYDSTAGEVCVALGSTQQTRKNAEMLRDAFKSVESKASNTSSRASTVVIINDPVSFHRKRTIR